MQGDDLMSVIGSVGFGVRCAVPGALIGAAVGELATWGRTREPDLRHSHKVDGLVFAGFGAAAAVSGIALFALAEHNPRAWGEIGAAGVPISVLGAAATAGGLVAAANS